MLLLLIVFIPHFVIFCFHCYYYPSHPIRFDLSTRRSIICQVVWNCTRPSSLYLRDKQKLWAPIFLNNNFEENNQLGKRQRLVWKLRDRKTFYLFCAPFQKNKTNFFSSCVHHGGESFPFSLNNLPHQISHTLSLFASFFSSSFVHDKIVHFVWSDKEIAWNCVVMYCLMFF